MERIVCDVVDALIRESVPPVPAGSLESVLGSRPPCPIAASSGREAYRSGSSFGSVQTGDDSCTLGDVDTDSSSTTTPSVTEFMVVHMRGASPPKDRGRGEVFQSPPVDRLGFCVGMLRALVGLGFRSDAAAGVGAQPKVSGTFSLPS
ncbi:hypothetical protein LIER_40351 [Lithospermum erythrorhizon]|uniref:Uncharacterized protein n=1 Tax=Lithospermum erythrorhizon TaxID=34254 RepID=A0AAV3QW96_LITER